MDAPWWERVDSGPSPSFIPIYQEPPLDTHVLWTDKWQESFKSGTAIDQLYLILDSISRVWENICSIRVDPISTYTDAITDALTLTWEAFGCWLRLSVLIFKPLLSIFEAIWKELWPILKAIIACAWQWQTSRSTGFILIEIALFASVIAILFLRHYIKKKRFIPRIQSAIQHERQKISTKKAKIRQKYDRFQSNLSKKSRILAQLLPHLLYWCVACTVTYIFPTYVSSVCTGLAFDILTIFYPVVNTFWVNRDMKKKAISSSNAGSNQMSSKVIGQMMNEVLMYWIVFAFAQSVGYIISLIPGFGSAIFSETGWGQYVRIWVFFTALWLQLPDPVGGIHIAFPLVEPILRRYIDYKPLNKEISQERSKNYLHLLVMFRILSEKSAQIIVENIADCWLLVPTLLLIFSPGFIVYGGCMYAGLMVPALNSAKVLTSPYTQLDSAEGSGRRRWLTYWSIYGIYWYMHTSFYGILSYIPFANHFQLAFILWLQLPIFRGSFYIVNKAKSLLSGEKPNTREKINEPNETFREDNSPAEEVSYDSDESENSTSERISGEDEDSKEDDSIRTSTLERKSDQNEAFREETRSEPYLLRNRSKRK